jgi:hypothetical protein
VIAVAEDTPLARPEFFFLGFQRGGVRPPPIEHSLPVSRLAQVDIWRPAGGDSAVSGAVQGAGLVAFHDGPEHSLELRFAAGDRGRADLRPTLPLVLRW